MENSCFLDKLGTCVRRNTFNIWSESKRESCAGQWSGCVPGTFFLAGFNVDPAFFRSN